MKIIDRLLILTLAVGVWALVLKPSPIEAHGEHSDTKVSFEDIAHVVKHMSKRADGFGVKILKNSAKIAVLEAETKLHEINGH